MRILRPEFGYLALGLALGIAAGRLGPSPTAAVPSNRDSTVEKRRVQSAPTSPPKLRSWVDAQANVPSPEPPTRELFTPLVPEVTRTVQPSVTVASQSAAAQVDVLPPTVGALSAVATEQIEGGPSLALVGITVTGGRATAIIEELESGLSRSVGAGGFAFGTEVIRIAEGEVVLSRNGQEETLQLGDGKIGPKVELISDGFQLGLSDPLNASLRELPSSVLSTLARVMPRAGVLRRVRSYTDNGQRVHRVEKLVDGLEHELRVNDNGEVLQLEASLRSADVPAAVVDAANRAVPGYRINPEDTPRLLDRNGQRYYAIEVRREGGSEEIDLRIGTDGRVLGQG